jgi:hypothetical protein
MFAQHEREHMTLSAPGFSGLILVASLPSIALAQSEPPPEPTAPTSEAPPAAPSDVLPATQPPSAEPAPAAKPPADAKPSSALPAYFQPGLLLQGWVVNDWYKKGGNWLSTSTARLRRADITVKGKIIPDRVSYLVMFDLARVLEPVSSTIKVDNQDPPPAAGGKSESVSVKQSKGAVAALQDYYIQYAFEYADVYFGQYKIPVSFDGSQTPSSELLMPDRSTPTTYFDDRRDIGLKATKKFKYLRYTAALFNGAGQGAIDNNVAKDAALRLDLYPVDGVGVGAVAYYTLAQVRHKAANDRYEADVRVDLAGVTVQAEYIRSHIAKAGVIIDGQGAYALAAYRITEALQPVVRVSYLDPDKHTDVVPKTQADLDEYWQYEAGLNYYLKKNEAKLQATYGRFEYDDKKPANQILVEVQVSYQ